MIPICLITGFLGKPEDPRTLLYKISVFITAIPSFLIIILSMDTFKILIFSQVALSIQLPFTLIPLLLLSRDRRIMGIFRSGKGEFSAALLMTMLGLAWLQAFHDAVSQAEAEFREEVGDDIATVVELQIRDKTRAEKRARRSIALDDPD